MSEETAWGEVQWLAQDYPAIKCRVFVLKATSLTTMIHSCSFVLGRREEEGKSDLSLTDVLMTVRLLKGLSVAPSIASYLQSLPVTSIPGILLRCPPPTRSFLFPLPAWNL